MVLTGTASRGFSAAQPAASKTLQTAASAMPDREFPFRQSIRCGLAGAFRPVPSGPLTMTKFDPAKSLSTRTSAIAEGAILAMAQKARELKASGADVISLTIGEPDFDTPEAIRQAAADAMNAGHTHYVPVTGIAELREAIAAKLRDENGIPATAADVVLANGAKQAITNACFATLDAGDEVRGGACKCQAPGRAGGRGGWWAMLAAAVMFFRRRLSRS